MGNRPGWTTAWSVDDVAGIAKHESGTSYQRIAPDQDLVALVIGSDNKIAALGVSTAQQLHKRLAKEAGDLFRKARKARPNLVRLPAGLTLREVFDGVRDLPSTPEGEADSLLRTRGWDQAYDRYRSLEYAHDLRIVEKAGWCLMKDDRLGDAVALLEPWEKQLSPLGLVSLGYGLWAKCSGWGDPTKKRVEAIAERALTKDADPSVPVLTFYLQACSHGEHAVTVIQAAYERYPKWGFGLLWAAKRRRDICIPATDIYKRAILQIESQEALKNWPEFRWECVGLAAVAGEPPESSAAHIEHLLSLLDTTSESAESAKADLILSLVCFWASAGRTIEFMRWHSELGPVRPSLSSDLIPHAVRADVFLGLQKPDGDFVRQTIRSLIDLLNEKGPYEQDYIGDLFRIEPAFVRLPDGTTSHYWAVIDLTDRLSDIYDLLPPFERGFVRMWAAQARHIPDGQEEAAKVEWCREVRIAAEDAQHPRIDLYAAEAWSRGGAVDWKKAGAAWTRFALWATEEWLGEAIEPLDSEGAQDVDPVSYGEGMLEAFAAAGPSEKREKIFQASLREELLEKKAFDLLLRLGSSCLEAKKTAYSHFNVAYASVQLGGHDEGRMHYQEALRLNPGHTSAVNNLLLLCVEKGHIQYLDLARSAIDALPADHERRPDLIKLLAAAQSRCLTPDELRRRKLHSAIESYPDASKDDPDVSAINFEAFVMLLALMRAGGFDGRSLLLNPYSQSEHVLEPRDSFSQSIFSLMESGLLGLDIDRTPARAVDIDDRGRASFYFGDVSWKLSPLTPSWVRRVTESIAGGEFPVAWQGEVSALAAQIAEDEVEQYLLSLAAERNWPEPSDTEKMADTAKRIVSRLPVSQGYYLCHLGAKTAADFAATKRVPLTSVATRLLNATTEKFDRWCENPYQPKDYGRTKQSPRSWMSKVLYEDLLGWGDRGFSERILDLPFPGKIDQDEIPASSKLH